MLIKLIYLLVNLIKVQQRSTTELNNIIVNGGLKASLLPSISITESLSISNADIEIASTGIQIIYPIYVGDLVSLPKSLIIIGKNEQYN